MADSDKTLEIMIKLLADTHGADKVQGALANVTKTTGATTAASADLGKATEELGSKQAEAGEHTEKLHVSHRALHKIMNMIGHETAPQLGHALGGALYGPIGAVIALGAAYEFIQKKIEAVKKEIEEINSAAADVIVSVWDAQVERANKATEAADSYAAAMKKIGDDSAQQAAAEIARDKAVAEAKLEEQRKILAAHEKLALAMAGDDEVQKVAIRARFEQAKAASELTNEAQRIAQEEATKSKLADKGSGLKSASDAAEKKYESAIAPGNAAADAAQAAETRLAQAKAKEKKFLEDAVKATGIDGEGLNAAQALPKMQEALDELKRKLELAKNNGSNAPTLGNAMYAVQLAQDGVDKLKANLEEIISQNAIVEANKRNVDQIKTQAADAKKAYDDNVKEIDKLTEAIKTARAVYEVHQRTAAEVNPIEDAASDVTQEHTAVKEAEKAAVKEERENKKRARAHDKEIRHPGTGTDEDVELPTDGQDKYHAAIMRKLSAYDQRFDAQAMEIANLRSTSRDQLNG